MTTTKPRAQEMAKKRKVKIEFTPKNPEAPKSTIAQINLTLPADWLGAIDKERGDINRNEWIREQLRKCEALAPYELEQPPGRGQHSKKTKKARKESRRT